MFNDSPAGRWSRAALAPDFQTFHYCPEAAYLRGFKRHRRPGRQVPDQPQQRLGAVHHVLVQLHLSVLGDYRHLGPLAVHIDADVDIAGSPLPSLESLTRSVPLPG